MDADRSISLVKDLPMRAVDILIENIDPREIGTFGYSKEDAALVEILFHRGLIRFDPLTDGGFPAAATTLAGIEVIRALQDFYCPPPELPPCPYDHDNSYGMF